MAAIWGDPPSGFMGGGHDTSALMNPNIWGEPSGGGVGGHPAGPGGSWNPHIPPQNGPPNAFSHGGGNAGGYGSSMPGGGAPPKGNLWDPPSAPQGGGGGWGGGPPGPQGGHQSNSGWGAPTPTGGWGMSAPPPGNWNNSYSTNPNATSPNGGGQTPAGRYSDIARKNVPAQPAPEQIRNDRPNYDPGTGNWGGQKVNQGVPWDVNAAAAQAAVNMNQNKTNEWRSDGTGHWGDPAPSQGGGGNNGTNNWGAPSGNSGNGNMNNGTNEWRQPSHQQPQQQPQQQAGQNSDMSWGAAPPSQQPPPAASGWGPPPNPPNRMNSNTGNWGPEPPPNHSQPQQQHQSQPPPDNVWVQPGPQGNPQGGSSWGGPSNHGGGGSTGFPARSNSGGGGVFNPNNSDTNSDMVWHDPNPKTKKVVVDKGTGAWGDPQIQGDIKRWKDVEDTASGLPTPSSASVMTPGNGGSVWDRSPVAPQPAAAATSQAPAQITKSHSTGGWGEPTSGGAVAPAPVNRSVSEWGPPAPISNGETGGWGGKPPTVVEQNKTENNSNEGILNPTSTSLGLNPTSNPITKTSLNGQVGQAQIPPALQALAQNPDLRDLTQQIADQLRVAVNKGMININILNQPLPQNVLLLLNQLLQRVPRLEQAQKELAQLQTTGSLNETQRAEVTRLQNEIQTLQTEIDRYKEEISSKTGLGGGSVLPPANSGTITPTGTTANSALSSTDTVSLGGSKLTQWQTRSPVDSEKMGKGSNGAVTAVSSALDVALSGLSLAPGTDVWGRNAAQGGSDWPTTTGNGENSSDLGKSPMKPPESGNNPSSENSASATPSTTAEPGPIEFIPGQRWEWRDPREVAEDPNATPGSLKPNPLNVGSFGSSGSGGMPNNNSQNSGNNMNKGGMNYPNNSMAPTSQHNQNPNNKFNSFDQQKVNNMMGPPGGPQGDIWRRNAPQPPTGWGAPTFPPGPGMGPPPARMNYRSMSSPGQSAFAPYGPGPAHWIILGHVNQHDEPTLRGICGRAGKMMSFTSPPNSPFAAVRFAEPVERLLPRIHQEVAAMGVTVHMAKDPDVERLMSSGPGRGMPMTPTPMPWAHEPPQSAGPWGAPPFNPGMMPDPMGPGPTLFHPGGFNPSDALLPSHGDHNPGF